MAAYYTRQRLPPPSQSFIDDLGGPSSTEVPVSRRQSATLKSSRADDSASFLIFPEPTAAANTVAPAPSGPVVVSPPSPSGSSSSLPTSLVASVNARRSASQGHSTSARSLSRGPPESSSAGEWEDLSVPQVTARSLNPSSTLRPSRFRGRQPPLATLAEARGSGWEWTLDREDDVDMAMLLSWQRLAGAASLSPSHQSYALVEEASEPESRYVDAASQFHEESLLADEAWASAPTAIHPAHREKAAGTPETVNERPKGLSLRLASPSRRQGRSKSPSPSATISNTSQPRSVAPAFVTLPLSTLLQAMFSIDTSTRHMIESGHTSSLFGISEPLDEDKLVLDHQVQQLSKLSESPAQESDRSLLKGFRATHFMPTSPFSLPFYIFNLGWTFGLKAWHSTEADDAVLEVTA